MKVGMWRDMQRRKKLERSGFGLIRLVEQILQRSPRWQGWWRTCCVGSEGRYSLQLRRAAILVEFTSCQCISDNI